MSNTFGRIFRLTTFGESHGTAIGGILDGCPAGLSITEEEIQIELDRRRPGQNKFVSPRKEPDKINILSGIFEGATTGTPIGLLIKNENVRSHDYDNIKNQYRPGHADYTYQQKYGIRDYRGGGRASARETATRVAAGAIAKKLLKTENIKIMGWVTQIGEKKCLKRDSYPLYDFINNNPFFAPDEQSVTTWSELITQANNTHDSLGAKITIVAKNIPVGLGEPLFDKLDALIAYAMMGIPAVKGVSIGSGFDVVSMKGCENNDQIKIKNDTTQFSSNHSGGILGGISSGQDIVVEIAIKPTSSINQSLQSIDTFGNNIEIKTKGRHDPCVGIRAVPIAEAMLALVICDSLLLKRSNKV